MPRLLQPCRGASLSALADDGRVACAAMLEALLWGGVAASSLVIGGVLALVHKWSDRLVGLVLAFGAGALISAVSLRSLRGGPEVGGPIPVAIGLAAGALTYFALDHAVETKFPGAGPALALARCSTAFPSRRCWASASARARGQHRPAGRDLRLQPAGGDRRLLRPEGRRMSPRARPALAHRCRSLHAVHRRGIRVGRGRRRRLPGRLNGFAAGALLVMLTTR